MAKDVCAVACCHVLWAGDRCWSVHEVPADEAQPQHFQDKSKPLCSAPRKL